MGKFKEFLRWVFADKADTKIVTEVEDYKKNIDIKQKFYDMNIIPTPGFSGTIKEELKIPKKKNSQKKTTIQIIEELKEVDKIKTTKKSTEKKLKVTDEKQKSEKKPLTNKNNKKKAKK